MTPQANMMGYSGPFTMGLQGGVCPPPTFRPGGIPPAAVAGIAAAHEEHEENELLWLIIIVLGVIILITLLD